MTTKIIRMQKLIIGFSVLWAMTSFPLAEAEDSKGGIFVEPSVTYESGDTSVNYPSPLSNSTGSAKGFGFGARIGFHVQEAYFLGLDLRYAMPQFIDSSVTYDAKSVSTNWGPVIGMQMPNLGVRLWASYILGGELNPEKSGGFDVKFQDATGYRFGAGFRISSVSLNLEYQQLRYGQATLEQLGPFSTGSTLEGVKLENKTLLVSVSFPFEF
jgi:hypothetical protein